MYDKRREPKKGRQKKNPTRKSGGTEALSQCSIYKEIKKSLVCYDTKENGLFREPLILFFFKFFAKKGGNTYVQRFRLFSIITPFLTLSPTSPVFYVSTVQTAFENTVGNEEIARYEQFLVFLRCFYHFEELSAIFTKFDIVICKLSFWKSLKSVVWETVKDKFSHFKHI